MPSDYDSIRRENIKEYGEGVRHLAFLGRLYSDRTHFILELLQNAEDAHATTLTFELKPDRLEVRHDGRPFTAADVRGICGVDLSGKADNLTSIGKFGIGFKSVYAYTSSPQIHSREESFKIEHFVRPYRIPERQDVPPDQTLQVFPFDHPTVPPETAKFEIREALETLDPTNLLFLSHLTTIKVITRGGRRRVCRRVDLGGQPQTVELLVEIGRQSDSQMWWLFQTLAVSGEFARPVQIAFQLDETENGRPIVAAITHSPLVVFFPTEKETGLGFLLQGPFRTTPARDNVPAGDQWNQMLIKRASELVVKALTTLKSLGLLTPEVLGTLPIRPESFAEQSMFRPMFDHVAKALRSEPLLPTDQETFTTGDCLRIARSGSLRKLFSSQELGCLLGSNDEIAWLSGAITADRTPDLYRYLRDTLQIGEMTPDGIVVRFDAEYLQAQSDDWLCRLYEFLDASPALYRAPLGSWDQGGAARSKPIIRLEDGHMVTAFDSLGKPMAYLPRADSDTRFPTVKAQIAKDPTSVAFLRHLGLGEPNAVTEVLQFVLPSYADRTGGDPSDEEVIQDIEYIQRAMEAGGQTRTRLLDALHRTPFLRCFNTIGETIFTNPTTAYIPNLMLLDYFDNNESGCFVDDIYTPWLPLLKELGCSDVVRIFSRRANPLGHVTLESIHGAHKRGLAGFDPDLSIDGLNFVITHPTMARARYLWNHMLTPRATLLSGVVERATRQDFSNGKTKELDANVLASLKTAKWLPGADATWCAPDALSLKDLPAEFHRDEDLARALGMRTSVMQQASKELGIPTDVLRHLQANPDEVNRIVRHLRSRNEAEVSAVETPGDQPPESFATVLAKAFEREPTGIDEERIPASGLTANPEHRRNRAREDIEQMREGDASRLRFDTVERKVWEARDSSVKQFLLEQYAGQCQVCQATFAQRDGTPYFEGLHMASQAIGSHVDRPGGVICLCPTCCRKFVHGTVVADDIVEQVKSWRPASEGGTSQPILLFRLCGQDAALTFTEKHLIDLQVLLAFEQ